MVGWHKRAFTHPLTYKEHIKKAHDMKVGMISTVLHIEYCQGMRNEARAE